MLYLYIILEMTKLEMECRLVAVWTRGVEVGKKMDVARKGGGI